MQLQTGDRNLKKSLETSGDCAARRSPYKKVSMYTWKAFDPELKYENCQRQLGQSFQKQAAKPQCEPTLSFSTGTLSVLPPVCGVHKRGRLFAAVSTAVLFSCNLEPSCGSTWTVLSRRPKARLKPVSFNPNVANVLPVAPTFSLSTLTPTIPGMLPHPHPRKERTYYMIVLVNMQKVDSAIP